MPLPDQGPGDPAVRVRDLGHIYPASGRGWGVGGTPRVALEDVAFEVSSGEIFGLLGPNGGGKTTTFRVLSTLLVPTRGEVSVLGFDVRRDRYGVRSRIGVVFQAPALDKKLTVRENLVHAGHVQGLGGAGLHGRIGELLDRFGLADRSGDRVEHLSGGLARRVDLARGLLHRPRLLVLDEPSAGLDPGARRTLWNHLKTLRAEEGVTILLTTHDLVEAEDCDRLVILNRGRVVAEGPPAGLKAGIGGEVVTLRGGDPEGLARRLEESMGLTVIRVGPALRIEHPDGLELLTRILNAFPGAADSATLGRPSLEDVFLRATGEAFGDVDRAD